MQRTNPIDPIHYRAEPGEAITITTTSIQVPNQAQFGQLSSGDDLTVVGADTATVKRRRFSMPASNTAFDAVYLFTPDPPPTGARYEIQFDSGNGSTDHHTINPDFNPFALTYTFVVQGDSGGGGTVLAIKTPAKKSAVGKTGAKKAASKKTSRPKPSIKEPVEGGKA